MDLRRPIRFQVLALAFGLAVACLPAARAHAQTTSAVVVPSLTTTTIIDSTTDTVLGTPTGPGDNGRAVVTPDGRLAYVTGQTGIQAIDLHTRTVVATFPLTYANPIAITPDGTSVYAAPWANATEILQIDVATNTLVRTIPLSFQFVTGIAISPDGLTAYVGSQTGFVQIVDLASGSMGQTISVEVDSMILSPDGGRLYAAAYADGNLAIVDIATRSVLSNIAIAFPSGLALTRDGSTLYVASWTNSAVMEVNTATLNVTAAISGLSGPFGVALTADGRKLYITEYSANAVIAMNTVTRLVDATIATGPQPYGMHDFAGPTLIVPAGMPLTITDDADLDAFGFRHFVNFDGGTLALTPSGWLSSRTISLLADGGTIDTDSHVARLSGPIVNDGVLTKLGAGLLELSGTATHGGTHVVEGTLHVTGTHLPDIELGHDAALTGNGTVGIVRTQTNAAVISPGVGVGNNDTLHASQITLNPNAKVEIDLFGVNGYDRIDTGVSGTMALNGAALDLNITFLSAPANTKFVIATNVTGTFAGLSEGANFLAHGQYFRISYVGGDGNDAELTALDLPPTIAGLSDTTIDENTTLGPLAFTIGDDRTPPSLLTVTATSSNPSLASAIDVVLGGSNAARTLTVTPFPYASGETQITVSVSDGTNVSTKTFNVSVTPVTSTRYLAEGATGAFFDTDILLANPHATPVVASIDFFMDAGGVIHHEHTIAAQSQAVVRVDDIAGLESATFSTRVSVPVATPIIVERTMWWDASGYGAHTEKASDGPALTWHFAEGAQGFFHTYFLLANPQTVPNVAHVTYLREGSGAVTRDYPMAAMSRFTIDAGADAALASQSFGTMVTFDLPGMAERAMYFGGLPMFAGGSASAGVTVPDKLWSLAEGATSSFFSTFLLIANPNDRAAQVDVEYEPEGGAPILATHTVDPHARLTIDVAAESPALASATFATAVSASEPIVLERSMYWPKPIWTESHNSAGFTLFGRRWGLAEGRVGGAHHAKTFILVVNKGLDNADVQVTFLRANGAPIVKTFLVPPAKRRTIAIAGPGSDVPELSDETFGAIVESAQLLVVERSMYADASGVTWAAGTNATATRLPEP